MPIIRAAPAFLAPITTARPTPPRPQMPTVDPARTLAVLRTAPYPVPIPHPMSPIFSNGAPGLICK